MSKPKPKIKRTCIICGCEFETARDYQKTCGEKPCADELKRRLVRDHYVKFGKVRHARPVKAKEQHMSRAAFTKIMDEIHAPIGDDEPLRRYVG